MATCVNPLTEARTTRVVRLLLTLVLTLMVAVAVTMTGGARGAHAWDVHGDDSQDTYSGVGSLILPPGPDPQGRREAATCEDCQWVVASACDTPYGVAFLRCESHVLACPSGEREMRAWMRHGVEPWADRGLICISSQGPPTRERLGQAVQADFTQHLPGMAPLMLPDTGIVTQLPVLFDSGQSTSAVVGTIVALGQTVELTAHARWEWVFGDGSSLVQPVDASRNRGMAVQHVYRHPGGFRVIVRARWSAQYTVDGLGPFSVPEPVEQEGTLTLLVGQARAALARERRTPPGMAR